MKKIVIGMMFIFSCNSFNAQWSYQTVDNSFDEPYKIANSNRNNNAILKLENVYGDIAFYLQGGYFCDEEPTVEMIFIVNGQNKKYYLSATKSADNTCLFLIENLAESNIFTDFKACSSMKIRVNESYCQTEVYTFNMAKSTTAFNYVLNQ